MIMNLPDLEEFDAARSLLTPLLAPTPLVPSRAGGGLLLKLETCQPIGSFKLRGVFHAVSRLTDAQRTTGLSTVSAGNTAQALAWCARHFGTTARSLMPEHAPRTKVEAVQALGGTPVLVPTEEVFRFLREEGWHDQPYAFIHPWTERDVLTGHGSLGLELVEQTNPLDCIYLPVGGGGLLAGVARAAKLSRPGIRIIAVEPEGCPALHESLRQGRPAQVTCRTMCDGVAVPYITETMFPHLRDLVDDVQLVPEAAVRSEVRRLALEEKLVAEPSGALASAAALHDPHRTGTAVAVVTGGSLDVETFVTLLTE